MKSNTLTIRYTGNSNITFDITQDMKGIRYRFVIRNKLIDDHVIQVGDMSNEDNAITMIRDSLKDDRLLPREVDRVVEWYGKQSGFLGKCRSNIV